jgi:hypothetical protein
MFGLSEQSSPISNGVMAIRISIHLARDKNLTTRHTRAKRAPRVATVHDVIKESSQVLRHPSAVFHTYASVDTPWVAQHYPF